VIVFKIRLVTPILLAGVATAMGLTAQANALTTQSCILVGDTFDCFRVPNATETFATSINNNGDIVGYFNSNNTPNQGFYRSPQGDLNILNFPGSIETTPQDINNLRQIVGSYLDSNSVFHGFIFNSGAFTTFNTPFSDSIIAGSNDLGDIVGQYFDSDTQTVRSYLFSEGIFSLIDVPSATNTFVSEINNNREIVGDYYDSEGNAHGFILRNNTFSAINLPGEGETFIYDINNLGDIVGVNVPERPSSLSARGFLYSQGSFRTIHVPGAVSTFTTGINDAGIIVLAAKSAPEPSSILSLLALGTLGAGATLKRQLKPSKPSEKETTKVG